MPEQRFIYKCRHCNKLDDTLGTGGNVDMATFHLVNAVLSAGSELQSPKMLGIHFCGEGKMGVTDLIGSVTVGE